MVLNASDEDGVNSSMTDVFGVACYWFGTNTSKTNNDKVAIYVLRATLCVA